MPAPAPIVAGVDVGGPRKGFHAVILQGVTILARLQTPDPAALADWISARQAQVVAIDAPCRWSPDGGRRAAERALQKAGTSCFATPLAERAEGHPFYTWIVQGMALYRALGSRYALFEGAAGQSTRCMLETFPQAVACALAGRVLRAADKSKDRPRLLEQAGLTVTDLAGRHGWPAIDWVDAALCALAAQAVSRGQWQAFGDARSGLIVVPQGTWPVAADPAGV